MFISPKNNKICCTIIWQVRVLKSKNYIYILANMVISGGQFSRPLGMGGYGSDKNSFGFIFTLLMFWHGNQGQGKTCVVFIHERHVLKSKNCNYILANMVKASTETYLI